MKRRNTEALIRALARDVACGTKPPWIRRMALPLASIAGLALALTLAFVSFDAGVDLGRTLGNVWFYHKLASMAAVGVGARLILTELARPGQERLRLGALLPAALLLGSGALVDWPSLSIQGRSTLSYLNCVSAILLLAMPCFSLILFALRASVATTRPAMMGAAAGLLSGAIAGMAYALACRNDGGLFVAVWYSAAVMIVAAFGAAIGRYTLAQ